MTRRWLLWLLVIGFAWLTVARFTEIKNLADTLAQGQWQWILAAVLLQILYYLIYSATYQSAFVTVDVHSRLRDLLPVTFASIFVNVVAPSGGASGAALFVDDAVRRGQPAARAAVGTILVLIADFSSFTVILLVGMTVLFLQHTLTFYEVAAALILMAVTVSLSGMLLLGLLHPERLRQLLSRLQEIVNRAGSWFRRPSLLNRDWSDKNAAEFTEAAQAMAARPRHLARTLAVALAAHLVGLASMYVLFLAFQYPITFGPLVAGYSMAILFLIVSPTPMGVGVVEGVTPLVLISLDVPAAVATVVVLAYRGLSFWLPMFIGFVLLQRLKSFSPTEKVQARSWNVRLVAILTAAMGVINILSAVTPSLATRMAMVTHYSPLLVVQGSHLTAALAGFALLVLAVGLWRHKHTAWLLTLAVLIISIISHLLKGLDYEEAILAAGLAVWLFFLGSHFQALSDTPSIRRGARLLVGALAFTLTYGTIGFYMLDRHFSVNFDFDSALQQTIVMFTEFYDPGLQPVTGFGRYFAGSIYMVGAITLGYALFVLIRPVVRPQGAGSQERSRAQAIVQAYGHSSLARMALFEDKSYWFSSGGSVIAFAAKGRVAIALGDPIGPPEDAAAAIAGFKAYCARHDWHAAFYQTLPDYLPHYRAAGFDNLQIGNEGVIDLPNFTISGKHNKSLRSNYNRFIKSGYRAEVHTPPLPPELLEELREVSDEWLTMMHGREQRFSFGWFDDDYVRNEPVMAIHTPEGDISAFTNIVTEYKRNGVSTDLMRRRAEVESGTMDFLFVSFGEWAKAQGYADLGLGLSALSGVGEQPDDPQIERALHYIYEHINQFYNFKGLHTFKEKFHPRWEPRYFVFENPTRLLAAVVVLTRASSGDDFMWQYAKELLKNKKDTYS
ncbi:MAG: flippase-like domain-containing protein [Anaerolineae bacterium]|nr:flippase-like domain-containing protein [Anaerolineae bacterium]